VDVAAIPGEIVDLVRRLMPPGKAAPSAGKGTRRKK
jgi:hypothetical protein